MRCIFRDIASVRMCQYVVDEVQPEYLAVCHISLALQGEETVYECCYWSLRERVACCHVHGRDVFGQAMYDGLQQRLVAHHYGSPAPVCHAVVLLEPLTYISCLDVFRRGADILHLLCLLHGVEDIGARVIEFVGEFLLQPFDVLACFVGDIISAVHEELIVIPVEQRPW